jgi:hypothetical protein
VCRLSFGVKYDSVKAVRRHARTESHVSKVRANLRSSTVDSYFVKIETKEEQEVSCAELVLTYHGVKHHHSYLSQDCGNSLLSRFVFIDFKLASKIHCGRTKAEVLVENVLTSDSLQLVLKNVGMCPYYVACDASNKGNLKLYPVAIRNFDLVSGTTSAILDFYEDSDETSEAIADNRKECISKAGLSGKQLVAYGADNCLVNYGKNKSIFVKLKNSFDLPNLIASHCSMHILHNAAKRGLKVLSFDVEMLLIKVFNEFLSSAKKLDELKDFFIFLETE